jgi:hypothetical protein
MAQRYLTGVEVFDTVTGFQGNIIQMDLDSAAIPPLAPLFTGAYFVVLLLSGNRQTYTDQGRQINHTTGVVNTGITLLTQKEWIAAMGAGYPH